MTDVLLGGIEGFHQLPVPGGLSMEGTTFDALRSGKKTEHTSELCFEILKGLKKIKERHEVAIDKNEYWGSWHLRHSLIPELFATPLIGKEAKENYSGGATIGGLLNEELLFDTNTGLYTTIIAQFIEQAIKPKMIAAGILKTITGVDPRGANAIKVPLQVNHAAGSLGNDMDISSRTATDYTSNTLTAAWYYCSTGISEELLRHSIADLMKDQITNMGWALGYKVDQVIIAALATAAPAGDANNNYNALGGAVDITWDALVEYKGNMESEHSTTPKVLLTYPDTWAQMLKDDDIRTAVQYASIAGQIAPGMGGRPGSSLKLLDMDVIVSPTVGANTTYLVDTDISGYFVPFVPLQVVDGRYSGKLLWEIVAYQAYAAVVTQTGSVFRIKDNT